MNIRKEDKEVVDLPVTNKTVVINLGHGGEDEGESLLKFIEND